MSLDEQIESNDNIKETISDDRSKAMGGKMHNRETETVTNVFKDALPIGPVGAC